MSPEETLENERSEPDTPRLAAWYDRDDRRTSDRPSVSVWWPNAAPTARLQTNGHGCNEPDTLPAGPLIAFVTIGGVEFGGYLDDMEWLLDAAREAVSLVRYQAECMAEVESESAANALSVGGET